MIKVIFHDNKKNRTDAIKSTLQGFKFLQLIDNEKDLFDSIAMLIENSHKEDNKTIIMHNSDFDSKKIDEIITKCEENNIDLVFFTGGDTTNRLRLKETTKANLSAEHLYTRGDLFYFLERFEKDYNLGYLVFGKNFELNNLLDLRMFLNYELNKGNNEPADIYDSLKEKRIDIDSLTEKLELKSGKSSFDNKMINSIRKSLDSKIKRLILDGDSKIEKPLLVHNDNTFLVENELFKDRNEKFDFSIDDFISDVLLNKVFDCLVIPFSLSENYLEFVGLELAYHIRLTKELGDSRFVPIVFFGAETPYSISKLNNKLSPILYNDGIYIIKEEEIKFYLEKGLIGTTENKIKDQIIVPPPSNYTTHHSVANEWSILRWAKYLGIDERKNTKINIDTTLYYKHLMNRYPIEEIEKGYLEIEGDGKILLIDDEYQKGWEFIFNKIFYNKNFEFETLKTNFEKTNDEIVKAAIEKIETFNPDLVLLDYRLHSSEFYSTKVKDFISIEILKKTKVLNEGIQVVIFTASNKVWNLQELERLGADGFIIKESPEFNRDKNFTKQNFKNFKQTIEALIEKQYLKNIFIQSTEIINKLDELKKNKKINNDFHNELAKLLGFGVNLLKGAQEERYIASAFIFFFNMIEIICNEFINENNPISDSNGKYFYEFYNGIPVSFYKWNDRNFQYDNIGRYQKSYVGNKISIKIKALNVSNDLTNMDDKDIKPIEDLIELRNKFIHQNLIAGKPISISKENVKDLFEFIYKLIIGLKL